MGNGGVKQELHRCVNCVKKISTVRSRSVLGRTLYSQVYAPVDNPRYAVGVVVEHGGKGSAAAAPMAKEALYEVQRLRAERMGIKYGAV